MRLGLLSSAVLLSLSSAACSSFRATNPTADDVPVVSVKVLPIHTATNTIRLRFEESTEFEHLVSEIQIDGLGSLVECWKTGFGGYTDIDWHTGMSVGEVRDCITYPAEVADVEWSNNFGHVKQNLDGSVVSNIPAWWNREYQENYPNWRNGRVVRADRSHATHWQVRRTAEGLEVRIMEP